MKWKFFIFIALALAVQMVLMIVIWGSPAQVQERSYTPTPSAAPYVPPTPVLPTHIPTLIPAALAAPTVVVDQVSFGGGECQVAALKLIGAWIIEGKPENGSFTFTDQLNKKCSGSFVRDVLPLFTQPNIWFSGSLACSACHMKEVKQAPANLSLVDYASILAGSRRKDGAATGNDILGDIKSWESSRLSVVILTGQMPIGRPLNSPPNGPTIRVGTLQK